MKMKELNAKLSLVGFFQLVVLGCTGGLITEILKDDRNAFIVISSIAAGLIAAGILTRIYLNVFRQIKKRRK